MRNILDLFTKQYSIDHSNILPDGTEVVNLTYEINDLKTLYKDLEQNAFNCLVSDKNKIFNLTSKDKHYCKEMVELILFNSAYVKGKIVVLYNNNEQLDFFINLIFPKEALLKGISDYVIQKIQTDVDMGNKILIINLDGSSFIHFERRKLGIESYIKDGESITNHYCRSSFYNGTPEKIIQIKFDV